MIGLPFNDLRCLGSITEVIAELVEHRDEILVQVAEQHPTMDSLTSWIRGLPQRDDLGARRDGPKIAECSPPQRLRLPAPDPNCVERAALYVAVGELVDPRAARQLATLDTPIGLHTFPLENGVPVILDPRVPASCLECGVAELLNKPAAFAPHDAIEWVAQLAETGASSMRNGPSRVRRARNAMMKIADGAVPTNHDEIESVAWLLSLAEQAAKRYGRRALALVRATAQAVADLIDEALARTSRNLSIEIGGTTFKPAPWLSGLGRIAARIGVDVGALALRDQLAKLGVTGEVLAVVEDELNREGITMGAVARPSRFAPLAGLAGIGKRAA